MIIFGIVRPIRHLLNNDDQIIYRKYYCGMCKALGEYGLLGKYTLSNDVVFLYIFLDGLSTGDNSCDKCRCVYPLWKNKECIFVRDLAGLLAAMNIIMFYKKLEDNEKDEHSVIAKTLRKIYNKCYYKAFSLYPEVATEIVGGLDKFYKKEAAEADYGELATAFGESLKGIIKYTSYEEIDKEAIGEFVLWMGRWIYVYDAWIDYVKDKKKKSFNPLLNKFDERKLCEKEETEIFEYLYTCQSRMIEYLQVLMIIKNREIVQNVIDISFTFRMGNQLKKDIKRERHD